MVSTRSQSRLSSSSVHVDGPDNACKDEVTSKKISSSEKRKKRNVKTAHPLDPICEEANYDALADKVAQDIFSALDNIIVEKETIPMAQLKWKTKLPARIEAVESKAPPVVEKDGTLSKQLYVPPLHRRKGGEDVVKDTAGKAWFDLPATAITDEVKMDLRLLQLRSTFDTKSFYRKFDSTKFPKYFEMGTVVEGPSDFVSGRLSRKQRKTTFAEEIVSDPVIAESRKKRYSKMQEDAERMSGRKRGRKTSNPRVSKKPKRLKH